jgi:hypothetical protein
MHRYVVHDAARTLSASTTRTLLRVDSASTRRLEVIELGVSMNSVTSTDPPVRIDLMRVTTAGTMSSFTPILEDADDTAALATAAVHATAEPTAGDILRSWYVSPMGGLFVVQFPLGREIKVDASARIALRAISGAATSTSISSYLVFEE